ncbi:MAG: class I SAM-dependent methyltransferase, partial [Alphaproteobacteria bacterium]|nr:class I SAM-dependent methyltransferase [Alphaproteobacteria bacterium]
GGYGYTAHRIAVAAMAAARPDRAASILDIGCGTGLVAVELAARGFTTIDGLDASPRMLDKARAKGVYRRLFEGDLRRPGVVDSGRYDAAIAVGVFGGGHVGPEDLECFARPVRAGGAIVLYANGIPWVADDYPSHLRRLEEDGVWTVQRTEESNYMDRIERPGWLVVARRAGGAAGRG